MKKTIMAIAFVFFTASAVFASEALNPTCDGTPQYGKSVMESYRKLQFKTSVYESVPEPGKGIRLGIYQAQAACGEGASPKNMALLPPYAEKVDQPDGSIRYYDSIAKYYGHTHPEPAYNYLKDRRPESYRELLAPKVNFMKGGYIYPHYQDGKETSAR